MKIVLLLQDGETKEGAQSIADEVRDKMEADYPEIIGYMVEE